jgi:hypothetical protein
MRFIDLFRPRGRVLHPLEQAATIATTPIPRLDDFGYDGTAQSSQFFALDGPTPAHIEWLASLSDELGRTITRLRMEVWRRGLQIVPLHPKYCSNPDCKEGIDEEGNLDAEVTCHLCNETAVALKPDPAEKAMLEDFMEVANKTFREDLATVGERMTEEMLKHGRGYLIFNLLYEVGDTGIIDKAALKGIFAGQSGRIVPIHRIGSGLPGGKFVCIQCRMRPEYKPKEAPGRCECGYVLYEATFAQTQSIFGGTYNMYWLPEEVHEVRWPYKDGTGPVRRLWPKVSTLLMMDWYAAWALDPKRDKRPDRILVTMGGDLTSIIKQLKENAELRKKNPYAYAHLHIPSPPGGLNEVKLGAEILDFGDKEFKGQMLDLRQEFEAAVRKQYGISSLTGGDTDEKGGLGTNDSPKLRTTAQVAEDIQKTIQKGLKRLAQKLGATQWTFSFHPALEEDDARKAEDTKRWLEVATTAAGAGLEVDWRDGKPHIQNGPVRDPNQQQMMGGDEFGGEQPPGDADLMPALDDGEEGGGELSDEDFAALGEGSDGVPITQLDLPPSAEDSEETSADSEPDFIPDEGEDYEPTHSREPEEDDFIADEDDKEEKK